MALVLLQSPKFAMQPCWHCWLHKFSSTQLWLDIHTEFHDNRSISIFNINVYNWIRQGRRSSLIVFRCTKLHQRNAACEHCTLSGDWPVCNPWEQTVEWWMWEPLAGVLQINDVTRTWRVVRNENKLHPAMSPVFWAICWQCVCCLYRS